MKEIVRMIDILKPLKGWEEIRQALLFVESLRVYSRYTLAGVEVFQQTKDSAARVFLKTVEELDSYLAPILQKMFLDAELDFNQPIDGLDVLGEVYGRIILESG
ncbi:MAG: hypothetical protein ACFFFK_08215 [Candidatus Thorarchaeota archaeon]